MGNESIDQLNYELLKRLLPSKPPGEEILRFICMILTAVKAPTNMNNRVLEAVHQLLQRLHFDVVIDVVIQYTLFMAVNDVTITSRLDGPSACTARYICSVILTDLQFDFAAIPSKIVDTVANSATNKQLNYAHAADEVWKNYDQQSRMKSLLRLCILRIRSSMKRLDDDSFLSLPIPRYIRWMLTYRDVSEKIYHECCEAATIYHLI